MTHHDDNIIVIISTISFYNGYLYDFELCFKLELHCFSVVCFFFFIVKNA